MELDWPPFVAWRVSIVDDCLFTSRGGDSETVIIKSLEIFIIRYINNVIKLLLIFPEKYILNLSRYSIGKVTFNLLFIKLSYYI